MRARVVKHNGEAVGMDDLRDIQKEWMKHLPGFLKEFMADRGLEVQALKWTGARKGSLILDFNLLFRARGGGALDEQRQQELSSYFTAWLAEQSDEQLQDNFPSMEIDYVVREQFTHDLCLTSCLEPYSRRGRKCQD